MGSSGSGNFTDYSHSTHKNGQGGSSNEDICSRAFTARVQELDRSDYYTNNHVLPTVGSNVTIALRGRPAAIADSGELIGYLPTNLNYIAQCLVGGFAYQGTVTISTTTPILILQIDCAPL